MYTFFVDLVKRSVLTLSERHRAIKITAVNIIIISKHTNHITSGLSVAINPIITRKLKNNLLSLAEAQTADHQRTKIDRKDWTSVFLPYFYHANTLLYFTLVSRIVVL